VCGHRTSVKVTKQRIGGASFVERRFVKAATGVADLAAEQKLMKYSNLPTSLIFQPIAVENLGAFSSSSSNLNQQCVWQRKRNFILVPESVGGIATIQWSSSARHLHVPG